jgi:hypothetical protein
MLIKGYAVFLILAELLLTTYPPLLETLKSVDYGTRPTGTTWTCNDAPR